MIVTLRTENFGKFYDNFRCFHIDLVISQTDHNLILNVESSLAC